MTPEARRVRSLDPSEVTVGLWVGCWAEWFPVARGAETAKHDGYMLAPFARRYGSRPLGSVTRLDAQAWAMKHPGQVRYLRRLWGKALIVGLVAENVWEGVQGPRRAAPQRRAPAEAQLDGALERARSRGGWWCEFADAVEFAAFTGARVGGVASLSREAVDLDAGRVTLTEKGGRSRTVVLAPRARAAVERQLGRRHGRLVWVTRRRRPLDRNSVGVAWREVRGPLGSFHSLRHFAATWLLSRGLSAEDVAIQLGHVDALGRPYTRLVERVYAHPDHGAALARIEAAVGGRLG